MYETFIDESSPNGKTNLQIPPHLLVNETIIETHKMSNESPWNAFFNKKTFITSEQIIIDKKMEEKRWYMKHVLGLQLLPEATELPLATDQS